ncbi:MAG: aminoglycoside phosphotransferase family protein [Bacteroidia bacterium]
MMHSDLETVVRAAAKKLNPEEEATDIQALSGGFAATVASFRLGEETLVFKYHGECEHEDPCVAHKEVALFEFASLVGIPSPQMVQSVSVPELLDYDALILSYMSGEGCNTITDYSQAGDQVAIILAKLHSQEPPNYPFPDVNSYWSHYLPEDVPAPKSKNMCALHADLWFGNCLWSNNEVVGVLDWEDGGVGDPMIDLAKATVEASAFFAPHLFDIMPQVYAKHSIHSIETLPIWQLAVITKTKHSLPNYGFDAKKEKIAWDQLEQDEITVHKRINGLTQL